MNTDVMESILKASYRWSFQLLLIAVLNREQNLSSIWYNYYGNTHSCWKHPCLLSTGVISLMWYINVCFTWLLSIYLYIVVMYLFICHSILQLELAASLVSHIWMVC